MNSGNKPKSKKNNSNQTVQTTLAYQCVDETPNGNTTIPYGLIRAVKSYLEFIGMDKFLSELKRETRSAPRLDLLVEVLIVYTLYAGNSMNACADWANNRHIKKAFGFRKSDNIDQRTLDRALAKIGEYRERILETLWKGISKRFEIGTYDVAVDGSAVILYGPKSRFGKLGHPRDGGPGDLQVEFTVAVLMNLGIPIYIKPYEGNISDEEQYRVSIPEISSLIQNKRISDLDAYKQRGMELEQLANLAKIGSTIVADNGAASRENMHRTKKCGNMMLTRVKLNSTDDEIISDPANRFEYLEDLNVMCYKHTFDSSGRTKYLFCSPDLFNAVYQRALVSMQRQIRKYKRTLENGLRRSEYVTIKAHYGVDIEIKISVQDLEVDALTDHDIEFMVREKLGARAGFFKLDCSEPLDAAEALRKYRQRGIVEQTIGSLKKITGIKPIRVWSDHGIEGSMILALLAEAVVSMMRYCVGKHYRSIDKRSKTDNEHLPSTRKIAISLGHLTLTHFRDARGCFDSKLSNWDELSMAIFEDIHAHEAPEWGLKKVPAGPNVVA